MTTVIGSPVQERPALEISKLDPGPPDVIVLHGWAGSAQSWEALREHLHAPMWAVDLPGYGLSPAWQDYTVQQVADGLFSALRDELDPARPLMLVGNCAGGPIAIELAHRFGAGHVRGVVLVEAFARVPWFFRGFLPRGVGDFAYATAFRNRLGRKVVQRIARDGSGRLKEGFYETPASSALELLRALATAGHPRELHELEQPVATIVGANSFGAVHRDLPLWRDRYRVVHGEVIEDASHIVLQQQPERAAQAMLEAARTMGITLGDRRERER